MGYTITVDCEACHKTGKILTGEGHPVNCPYCEGKAKRVTKAVHPSHKMTAFRSEILAPAGTPRFYAVRNCTVCEKEEWEHAAGHFLHGLDNVCSGKPE